MADTATSLSPPLNRLVPSAPGPPWGEKKRLLGFSADKKNWWREEDRAKSGVVARKKTTIFFLLTKLQIVAPTMSLSVPQNGVKADNEPVIELFVKVRPQSHGRSFFLLSNSPLAKPSPVHCGDECFIFFLPRKVM